MPTRTHFLKGTAACIVAAGAPKKALAATPYSVDGEYRYGEAGVVRTVTFARTARRNALQCIFATLMSDRVNASIVAGSQASIPRLQLSQIADHHNAIVAVNGGFFQMDSFSYDGLLIIDGREIASKNANSSGAVVIDDRGMLSLQRIADVSKPPFAMQTGPFIIDPGGKMGIRSNGYDGWRRSFIAQSGKIIVTGVTSDISLYDLAQVFLEFPDAFLVDHFDAALNLSGAASSAFFARIPQSDIREGGGIDSPAVITFALL